MARMNAAEFIRHCNNELPNDFHRRKVTVKDLERWKLQSRLRPDRIGQGEFYYQYHYWQVLKLLREEKAVAEKPKLERTERERREVRKLERKIATRDWQVDHGEARARHNRTYYLQRKRKIVGLSEQEELELPFLLSERWIKRNKT